MSCNGSFVFTNRIFEPATIRQFLHSIALVRAARQKLPVGHRLIEYVGNNVIGNDTHLRIIINRRNIGRGGKIAVALEGLLYVLLLYFSDPYGDF